MPRRYALLLLTFVAPAAAAPGDEVAFFEKKVRPILVDHCLACHGAEKQKGGLRLDSRAASLAGGDRGAGFVPGKPEASLLVQVLAHKGDLKMPPAAKLPAAEVAILTDWVRRGAPWPDAGTTPPPRPGERAFTAEERAFWAFQPVRRPALPDVTAPVEMVRNPIDRFILAKLRAAGLTPAPEADARTLLRRLTLDLTGLPPTSEEMAEFEQSARRNPHAASEQTVERLLASPAYGERWGRRWLDVARYADSNGMDENLAYVNAWRFRDYVIRAFNADKPYDEFVREQLAGDLLTGGNAADRLTATGFLVFGPKMLAEDDPVKMRMDIIDEQLDTVGQAFLGLTLGCARCHDHKFDPITLPDYYGLAGIFYSTRTMQNHKVVAAWHERPLDPTADSKTAPKAMAVEDEKGQNLRIHLRGNHLTLGVEAPRRLPRILAGDAPLSLDASRSGRHEFAQWVTRPDNPLTARVMVNRIWAGHFGAGIVRTPDNFGRLGERPTHPELLDWLADEFVRSGWSVKHLHRLIVTSATYRRASQVPTASDPDNRLLAHFSRRRLEAEEVRDGMLAVAGLLDRKGGGSLLTATPRQYVTSTASKNYEGYAVPRRSVYLPVIRSAVFDVFQTLDFPDPSVPSGQRATTTVPTQALLLLNSKLADQTAEAFARWVLTHSEEDRIAAAYQRAYLRAPSAREVATVRTYLAKAEPKLAWRGFCRVLLASNEFAFVE